MKAQKAKITRRAILEAACGIMHRHGFRGTSLTDLTAATSLTKGAVYHHFKDKQAVGYAVVDELLAPAVRERWIRPIVEAQDPLGAMISVLDQAVAGATDEDACLGCPVNNLALEMSSLDEGFRLRLNAIYDEWREGLARALRRGQDEGTVAQAVDPGATATFVVGAMAGCRSLAKNSRSAALMREGVESLRTHIEMLRASGPGRKREV